MIENLTIVIPFFNGHATIDRLIRSIPRKIPVIIVDDLSDEPLIQERIDKRWEHPEGNDIKVIRLVKKGYFAGAVNRGIQESKTDVLVLNQDIFFNSDAFVGLIESLRGEYAFFGERIRGIHPAFGELGYVHGTFMFIRRDVIREVGLLNVKDYPLWGNTAEYQWRVARKNYKILPLKEIPGFYHERQSGERFGSSIRELLEREPDKTNFLVRTPPLLSVVIPCYNYGRYLHDCIHSLIGGDTSLGHMPGQTINSFEIVIVDDASTDNSLEFIREVTDISKGIRSYHLEKNVGTARALNFGIERCYGKYITFLSADDMREPDSLEKMLELCEQNPHSFVYDDIQIFHTHQRLKKWRMEEYDFDALIWKNHVHAGIMFPRVAWQEVGGYPPAMGDGREDWAFNIALGIHGWCGVHLKNYGYLYRREGQNRTETNTTETHRERFLEKIMGLFPNIYKGNRPMACCGKGSGNTSKKTNTSMARGAGITTMRGGTFVDTNVTPIGKEPMERIEYLGNQMNFTVTGDVTNSKYTFGKDRPRGWVFKSDVGERDGKLGFLTKRGSDGNYLYRIVASTPEETLPSPNGVEIVPEVVSTVVETPVELAEPVAETVTGAPGTTTATGTLTAVSKPVAVEIDTPNPTDLTVEELRLLATQGLTREQWERIYTLEMAGRNRKGAVAFIEELLAGWDAK